ncbi:uncharacterized protein LOC5570918 isoform X1 [Aedes aegypti]|uniref:Uncharacterized protein n=2 Tax=Aedes aegypti TaxID=7159 RepID=A0A903TQD7_AEDAE|nr:uncharacterized protein LOC5570918 isoform X1 [Aedes aegypti]
MLRTLVLLLLGSAVLAGPVIPKDRRLNRSEDNAVENSSVAEHGTAVTEAAVLNEASESSSTAANSEASSTEAKPSQSSTAAPPTTMGLLPTNKPRKTITFDQRQEGKFNIRADLENFVIVVVPSSPSAGVSLLDLLNRAGHKNHQKKKSGHRKNTKNHGSQKKSSHVTPEVVVLDESQTHARVANEEFIEGRTPYRVDISSSARSSNFNQPSPIYRVYRPNSFHVEQPTSSNLVHFPESSGNSYPNTVRASKSLLGPATFDDEIRTNTVYAILTNNNNYGDGGIQLIEDDETGGEKHGDDDDEDNYLSMEQRTYLDLPASSFDSLEYPRSDVDMMKLQLQEDNERDGAGGADWELKLLGAQEQCGPDRKRDSYGVCQFVTP